MSDADRQLPAGSARPYTRSRPLPPYRGILAVDAKDFTGYPAIEHRAISQTIPKLLQTAFDRAELIDIWEHRRFPESTGDGYVFGFEPAAMPFVIHPWLTTLQKVLTEFNVHSVGTVRIRLRVSLHIGPLPDTESDAESDTGPGTESDTESEMESEMESGAEGNPDAEFAHDGNGTPRNDTHRLLDSRPVKAMLASSSENITQLAAIISDRCYQDAVVSGYTGRHPDYFIEVPATVEGKQFEQRAWLYVPAPSGNLYDRRILGDRVVRERESGRPGEPESLEGETYGREENREENREKERGGPAQRNTYRADRGIVNTGEVTGGQHVRNVDVDGDYVGGDSFTGNKAGTVHGNQGDTVGGDKYGDTYGADPGNRNGRRNSGGGR